VTWLGGSDRLLGQVAVGILSKEVRERGAARMSGSH
jgi:hypothetical protein